MPATGPTAAAINTQGNYLNIGQNATGLQDQATAQNNQQNQAFWSGLTNLLGVGGQLALGVGTGGGSLIV